MTFTPIANFFVAHWLELAGTLTTAVGIWLTARRTLLCWPVTLAADILYLVVFFHARLLSDSLLQIFFVGFTLYGWWHWWRGVRQEGEVRVVPLAHAEPAPRPRRRGRGHGCSRNPGPAPARGTAISRRRPHQLQPRRQLVAGAQAYRQLVALDRRRSRSTSANMYTKIYGSRRSSMPAWSSSPCIGLARLAARRTSNDRLNRGLHHIPQRLAPDIAAQLVRRHLHRARSKLRSRPAHMRRDQQIGALPQRMLVGQRFRIGHIDRGANVACVQRRYQAHRFAPPAPAPHSPAALPAA